MDKSINNIKENLFVEFYNENYIKSLNEFLGFTIELSLKEGELEVEIVNIPTETLKINEENVGVIKSIIKQSMMEFYIEFSKNTYNTAYAQILIEKIVLKLMYCENSEEVSGFIELLKKLSSKTYEQSYTEISFIVFKDKNINIKDYLNKINIDYIKFKKYLEREYLFKDKQTYKLIDGKSLAFVVDSNYKIVGIAKKNSSKKSISDIMKNRNKQLEDIEIKEQYYQYFVEAKFRGDNFDIKFNQAYERLLSVERKISEVLNIKKYTEGRLFLRITTLYPDISKLINRLEKENAREEFEMLLSYNGLVISLDKSRDISVREEEYLEGLGNARSGIGNHENVDFVTIKNRKIYWHSTHSYELYYDNGFWKLRNFAFLSSHISRYVLVQYFNHLSRLKNKMTVDEEIAYILNKIDFSTPRVLKIYDIIRDLSLNNIGSLILILERTTKKKKTIYNQLLKENDLSTKKYSPVIQNEKNKNLNINAFDPYLINLLASIDGAILMNYQLDVLSFGEMIDVDKKIKEEYIEKTLPNNEDELYRGARTNAARDGSYLGLSIKVSEDGDIEVFEKGIRVFRI